MTTHVLNELLQEFHQTEQEEVLLDLPKAVQVACNALQTALAILQKEGANGNISLSLPKKWQRMQELAEEYTAKMGLDVHPLNYSGITVNRYSAPALRYAYSQILSNPQQRTIH